MKFSAGDRVRISDENLKPYLIVYPELGYGETLKVSRLEARDGGLVLWVTQERHGKNGRNLCIHAKHCVRVGGRMLDGVL
jgi:hypothetical protein